MLNGWTDMKGRALLNFLVASSRGIIFLKSIDASTEGKNVELLSCLLGDVVEEVGVEDVVQIITNNKIARKILMERFFTLVWTP